MVKPSSSTKRSKPLRSGAPADQETRDRILDAAEVVFTRKGTARSRTQEIAGEAGINKALLHYYFGTKEALADAVFARALATITPTMFGIIADPGLTLEEKIPAIVNAQLDFHSARPYFAGYLLSELHAEPERITRLMARRGPIPLEPLRKQLREASRAGNIRPIRAEQFVANMMGLLIFPFAVRPALRLLLDLDDAGWRAFLAERRRLLPEFFLAGLRP
jgi:TetR/AcrR family transcriptional regulator